jgi:hypothetical protein
VKKISQIRFSKSKPNNRTNNLLEILFDRICIAFNDHLFLQLHRNAKLNLVGFKDFFMALVTYQLDTDQLLMLQELKPKYKKFIDTFWFDSYEFVFWGRLFTRLDKQQKSQKIRATLTSNFLSKCLNIELAYQIEDKKVRENAEEILFCVIEVIKVELKKDWTEKLFIDDRGIVCS